MFSRALERSLGKAGGMMERSSSSSSEMLQSREEFSQIKIGHVQYALLKGRKFPLITKHFNAAPLTPITLIRLENGERVTRSTLLQFRELRLERDDVWQEPFLQNFVLYGAGKEHISVDDNAAALLNSWASKWSVVAAESNKQEDLAIAPGPYVVRFGMLWEPWRVYEDFNGTMVISLAPGTENDGFSLVDDSSFCSSPRIIVPSRCFFEPSEKLPLAGMRLAIKDIFDIKGVRTSLCNRSWRDFHGPCTKTAPSIQRLIDQGAIVVGKTKLNAMIIREEPMECVEYLSPFNPRGDGYQTSSGSSSGSCAALASYTWLDMAVGSDTNGSSRKPAYWNGCFSLRTTHGSMDMLGVASFCPFLDAPAFFGRDVTAFADFARRWYGGGASSKKVIGTILYPADYLPTPNSAQSEVIEKFVKNLERKTGLQRTYVSLQDKWQSSQSVDVVENSLQQYLEKAGTLPYYHDAYIAIMEFLKAYEERFGHSPYFHPAMHWRWKIAQQVSQKERDELYDPLVKYKSWLLTEIFRSESEEATVMVLPIENGEPSYRDQVPPPFALISGYSPLYVSPISGGPEITAPVGTIPYLSRISNQQEEMPISVALTSSPGTDALLIDLMSKLCVDMPVVNTGRSICQ